MATYQITIPDSIEWKEETRDLPYRRLKAKLLIYTLYLDLVEGDGDELEWVASIYDDIIDAEIFTNIDESWYEDSLDMAQEAVVEEALSQLRAYLVNDFGAVEISDDSIDTESGIDSLDLED